MPRSRFKPKDPQAVHERFEQIKRRVIDRLDQEWERVLQGQPNAEPDDAEPTGEQKRRPRAPRASRRPRAA